jgi:uncharacterized protein (DUF2141 family)
MGLSHAAFPTDRDSVNRQPSMIEPLEPRTLLTAATLMSPVNTTFPAGAVTTVEGNLNGTGIPSIVAGYANGSAQVFIGSSNGSLAGGQVLNTGGTVEALGHFTTSGNLDLATASGVFEGNGNGTFAASPIAGFTLPTNTVALYAVDVNGDGNTDLVAGIYTPASGNTAATVSMAVMLGNGNGTFGSPIVTTVGSAAGISSAYAADFVFGKFTSSVNLDVVTPFGLMAGTGSGSFGTPTPLPGTSSSVPTGPVLADFTSNGNLDVAFEPPGATAGTGNGNIEILTNNGAGTFTVGQTIDLSADGGVSTLTAADINEDSQPDLIAGVGNVSGSPDVAVMLNNGVGAFQSPTFFSTTGVPVTIFTGDFNGDFEPDLLAIDASTGVFPGTTLTPGASAAAFINSSPIPSIATVTITTTANPTIINVPVQFTAKLAGPSGATAPTGTVTFYDAGVSLATATVSSGVATFSTSSLAAGQHSITAQYSGDTNYDAANSPALTQKVLQTSAKTPLVVPAIPTLTAPATPIAGDKAIVALTINNEGGAAANGTVAATFYLSADGVVDSSSVAVITKKISVHLGIGGAATSNVTLKLPALPAGTYAVLVQLTAVSKLTSDQVATTVAASPTTFQSLGYAFGTLGVHKNVKTTVADEAGVLGTFSLTGPGQGIIVESAGVITVDVTGTTAASAITVASKGGSFSFNDMIVNGPVKSLNAKATTIVGLSVGSGSSPTITLGTVTGDVVSGSPIATLAASSLSGGSIDAPSIGTLKVTGTISDDVFTHSGGGIGSTRIGDIAGGTWAIAGNINTLKVLGSVSSAEILAGADTGADDTLGTSDDIYSAATIGSITIFGSDTSTTIGAGAVPNTTNGTFQFLPNSAIRGVVVKGAVSSDARFLAFTPPTTASLDGTKVTTATDPHFES